MPLLVCVCENDTTSRPSTIKAASGHHAANFGHTHYGHFDIYQRSEGSRPTKSELSPSGSSNAA